MDPGDVYSRPGAEKCAGDTIPLLVDGTYHLFHLTPPAYTIFHPNRCRCSWDRLKSTDLVNWTRDPQLVIPHGPHEDDVDCNGAWTGSALIGPDEKMHIFYTGYNMKRGGEQVILHAKAPDKHGSSFTKPTGPIPVVSPQGLAAFESIDFRDPYVFWNATEGKYWMLVATRLARGPHWTRGAVALLTSSDLEDWHAEPEPLHAPNDIFCPECPELFSLPNGKWYLVYSRFSAPYSGTLYRVADNPRGPFRTPRDGSGGLLDGRRWYAAKSCPKARDPSKRIFFGWVPDYYEKDGKWLWGGSLCPPRELSARADGSLRLDPVPELLSTKSLAGLEPSFPKQVQLQSVGKTSARFLSLPAHVSSQRYSLAFQIAGHDARSFGVFIQTDNDLRGHQLRFEPVPGAADSVYAVTLLTDIAPLCDFWSDLNSVHVPKLVDGAELVKHGAVQLGGRDEPPVRVFVGGRVVEVFVGGKVLTYRLPARKEFEAAGEHGVGAPPKADKIHELGLFVEDGAVEFCGIALTAAGLVIP